MSTVGDEKVLNITCLIIYEYVLRLKCDSIVLVRLHKFSTSTARFPLHVFLWWIAGTTSALVMSYHFQHRQNRKSSPWLKEYASFSSRYNIYLLVKILAEDSNRSEPNDCIRSTFVCLQKSFATKLPQTTQRVVAVHTHTQAVTSRARTTRTTTKTTCWHLVIALIFIHTS